MTLFIRHFDLTTTLMHGEHANLLAKAQEHPNAYYVCIFDAGKVVYEYLTPFAALEP